MRMPICRDPFVANLQAQGFNALRVPRTDYVPGTILFHVRKSPPERFGELSDAFEQAPTVEVIASSQADHFTGVSTGRYRRQMGLKLAAQWLGVPQAAVEAALGGFTRVSFHFAEMRLLSSDMASIAALLPGGEPTEALLALPDSRLFVVHEVIQAKQISCLNEIENQNATSVAVSVEAAAKSAAKAGLELNADKASLGLLVFSSKKHHTIGFKAYEIELADGEYRLRAPLKASGLTHLTEPNLACEPVLFEDELF